MKIRIKQRVDAPHTRVLFSLLRRRHKMELKPPQLPPADETARDLAVVRERRGGIEEIAGLLNASRFSQDQI